MSNGALILSSKINKTGAFVATLSNQGKALAPDFSLNFSLLAPAVAIKNCQIVKNVGGFHEIKPPKKFSLSKNKSWTFSIAYSERRHKPLNISWCFEGVYVVTADNNAIAVKNEATIFPNTSHPVSTTLCGNDLKFALLPSPLKWQASGGYLLANSKFNFKNKSTFGSTINIIEKLINDCGQDSFSKGLKLVEVLINQTKGNRSSYEINIKTKKITITATSDESLKHALISLAQLRVIHTNGIPCGIIKDQPRFNWRGMHLDTARHYYSVTSIKRVLNLMALLKFNYFHWHLIDDEAVRLDLKSYPQLAKRTSFRGHNELIPGVFAGGIRSGGYYSVAEIKEILNHANDLGINVMPELELPAHAFAILKVHPEMLDPFDKSNAVSIQGYRENVFNPAMPATWKFIQRTLKEIAEIFNPAYIHLGGDEIPPKVWSNSPSLERFKTKHKLKNAADVQEWFMQQAAKMVTSINPKIRPAAWADAQEGNKGGIKNNTLLFAWEDYQSGVDAAKKGYDVVMCPAHYTYLDMAPNNHPSSRGMNWARIVNLQDTVSWEPVPKPSLAKNIIGVQGAFWSETIFEDQMIEPMLAPRILGIAETAWAQKQNKIKANDISKYAQAFSTVFGKMNWQVGPEN